MSAAELRVALTIASLAAPALLLGALSVRAIRSLALRVAPWSPVPALLASFVEEGPGIELESVLFGARLGPEDEVARTFLFFTACLWLASGLYARAYVHGAAESVRFTAFFLASYLGNVGLVIAGDVATFYAFFTLMTFAAYGLIVHDRTEEASRAGRVYVAMSLVGEMFLLAAFVVIVAERIDLPLREVPRALAASAHAERLAVLLLVGFGIKAGAFVLHVWLPLAHPVAPTPASAVLSGSMIKAGLLGWLRFLPLGVVSMPELGVFVTCAGLAGAFYGVGIGLTQRDPKTILAYSSVSQMGFMMVALGIGLANADASPAAVLAILFYAVHHAFAKGALFLGAGVAGAAGTLRSRRLVALGLLFPALDLAGAPLSSGALAKVSLKEVVERAPMGAELLEPLLSVGAVGSTLLVLHFVVQTVPRVAPDGRAPSRGLVVPFLLLLLADLAVFFRPPVEPAELRALVSGYALRAATWPIVAGLVLALSFRVLRRRGMRAPGEIPRGDLVVLAEEALGRMRASYPSIEERLARAPYRALRAELVAGRRCGRRFLVFVARIEARSSLFATIGLLFVLLLASLLAATLAPFR